MLDPDQPLIPFMKTSAVILYSVLLGVCAFIAQESARADTVLSAEGNVLKDGVSLNGASDALLNGHVTSAEFMAALKTYMDGARADVVRARADLTLYQARVGQVLATDLTALQSALAAATDDTQKQVLAAQIALVQGYQATFAKSAEQTRADALAAEIAAKQAELAKLQQGTP